MSMSATLQSMNDSNGISCARNQPVSEICMVGSFGAHPHARELSHASVIRLSETTFFFCSNMVDILLL